MTDRLFVPLKKEPFNWFLQGCKTWELRGISGRFNKDKVKSGKSVELRKGYNGDSLWGVIANCKTFDKLKNIPTSLRRDITPFMDEYNNFEDKVKSIMSEYESYIAFNVDLYWLEERK